MHKEIVLIIFSNGKNFTLAIAISTYPNIYINIYGTPIKDCIQNKVKEKWSLMKLFL